MGIIYAPAKDPGVDTEDLITTEIAAVMPKTHPLAKKRYIGVGDLPDEAFISLGATYAAGHDHRGGMPQSERVRAASSESKRVRRSPRASW